MAGTIKGAGIFLARFASDAAPFNSLGANPEWAASLGYDAAQIPTFDARLFDLEKAAKSRTHCDEVRGICAGAGVTVSEVSTHLQGQPVAVHQAYDLVLDAFEPTVEHVRPAARQEWPVDQMHTAARASRDLRLGVSVSFSGSPAFRYLYLWPQQPTDLIEDAFAELASLWVPILDAHDAVGVDIGFELHPGKDLSDGADSEHLLATNSDHAWAPVNCDPPNFLPQHRDHLVFIDLYHDRICTFHVKDAEFNPTARGRVHGGYTGCADRAATFRSSGDGQIVIAGVVSRLCQIGHDGDAVPELEGCAKSSQQGAAAGAAFLRRHIIETTDKAFDDFAGGGTDRTRNRTMLGPSS